MAKPNFIEFPPTKTEMETARLLAIGKTLQQIADIRYLSLETIKDHSRSLRNKFHVDNTRKLINRMIVLDYLPVRILGDDFPPEWLPYCKAEEQNAQSTQPCPQCPFLKKP